MTTEHSNPITETENPFAGDAANAADSNGAADGATDVASNGATGVASTDVASTDVARRSAELAVLDALRSVFDPELGMDVVELALIRRVLIGEESSEVKMVLTTPFCPYAGAMIAEIQEAAKGVLQHPVKVTLLAERWDPRDAGLAW
jgi:metal-sulfur cluster biosynthetic enzyme